MVSKYYNVNLRMPNYWSSGVLRKTGNKIFVYLAPDYIIGEYKNGKFYLTFYKREYLIKDVVFNNADFEIKDIVVDFKVGELLPDGEIFPFQIYKFIIDHHWSSLEIIDEIKDFDKQLDLEDNYFKNIPYK